MKLKRYVDNGLGISQNKYCKSTFLSPTTSILDNIQSSSNGQYNIITSEITTNPLLLLQNRNYTCKSMSISVVVLIKYRQRKKNFAVRNDEPTINFDFFT